MNRLLGLGLTMGAAAVFAGTDAESSASNFKWGGDLRTRQTYFDNIPIAPGPGADIEARNGVNNFFRFRTRLWAELEATEQTTVFGRAVNEFRHYKSDNASNDWNAPDELIIDQLYLDFSGVLGGNWDIRIGRQDLIYGTGKVILDGTPKDDSRTIYFDAVKATYKGLADTEIDFLVMHTDAENELALHRENRDINGPDVNDYYGAETGGGIYLKNHSFEKMPLETYGLFKHENEWFDPSSGRMRDTSDVYTGGVRLMPKFSETVGGNLEAAYQFGGSGGNGIRGYMIDSALNWTPAAMESVKGCFSAGWYYLSGDDADSTRDEGWNPLWSRWPQFSELYVYAFDADGAGRWSNVSMPHIGFCAAPHERLGTSLLLGYLFAPEKDGTGSGDRRGFLATWRNDFRFAENLISEGDSLYGHLLLEVFEPGNYYVQEDTAVFARWELSYRF